jgi:replicative DNA helicase
MEPQLPQSIEAEKAVLGCIMDDPATIEQVIDTLSATDFYRDAHRVIYGAMCDLYSRNELVDGLTVRDEIERQGNLGLIDGPGTLVSLMNEVMFSDNIGHYAAIVSRTSKNRKLIEISHKIAAAAYLEKENSLQLAEELIFGIGGKTTQRSFYGMDELVQACVKDLDYRHAHRMEMTGVPSGLYDLDTCTGGFQKSDVIILAARPSAGKTPLHKR